MKYTNRKPKAVATLTVKTEDLYNSKIFKISKNFVDVGRGDFGLVNAINNYFELIKNDVKRESDGRRVGYAIENSEIINCYINNPFNKKVRVMVERKATVKKGKEYLIKYNFYAVDCKSSFLKNEINIPSDSFVFNVSNDDVFTAFVKNGDPKNNPIVLIRDDESKESVDITYIQGEAHYRNEDGHFVRFNMIDNTDHIKNGAVVRAVSKSSKTITYISNSGKKINIDKDDFVAGKKFRLSIEKPVKESRVVNAKFIHYNLSVINKALKGVVKAIVIDGEIYLSEK